MGLLDSVLGQVLGNMTGGPAQGSQGGAWNQSPSPAPGGGGGGGVNPLVLALLALVASRTLSHGAGGLGSKLRDLVTGGNSAGSGMGGGPGTAGGVPGGAGTFGGSGPASPGGGFLDQIGGMLGGSGAGGASSSSPASGGLGGGLVAGGLGGLVGSGLGGLLERFAQNGHGDIAQSWVGSGPNQPIAPDQLDSALGSGTVDELSRETGLNRGDLLSQLSHALPQVVDGLTPHGRLPEEHEESQWV